MEPGDSVDVTLACDGERTEAHKVCLSNSSKIEKYCSETTLNITDEERLLSQQKSTLKRLYRFGEKKAKAKAHVNFLQRCLNENVITKGFELHRKRFVGNKKRIEKCSKELMDITKEHFREVLEEQSDEVLKTLVELKSSSSEQTFSSLHNKWQSSMMRRQKYNILQKEKKFEKAKNDCGNVMNRKKKKTDDLDRVVEIAKEFFDGIEKIKKKRKRRKNKPPSKAKLSERKREKRKQLKQKKSMKQKNEISEHPVTLDDPLGPEEETIEDLVGQFYRNVEGVKVKNFSDIPMPDSVKAFLSLGAKFCPNELDIDRAKLEIDLESWFRRLKLKANFQDKEDLRTEEEKRFYKRSDWTPQPGKFAALDMFIFRIRKRFDEWIVPRRIRDNMTKIEREGMELVKNDDDHIYRLEDKGSSIVRMKTEHYEKNAKDNLERGNQYEKLNSDPTKETVEKVVKFLDDLKDNGHIKETTAEVIKSRTKDAAPGAYTEQPKTHKFKEESQDMAAGFPARGIISCRNTPTESLQDYVDFILNPGMRKLPSFLQDTKHVLQKFHLRNEDGPIEQDTNLITADFENMYGLMPLELSKRGVRKHLESRVDVKDEPTNDEALEALDICQQNNVFEFDSQLYRQVHGHGTGQKQAPPVACLGAGEVEQEFLALPGINEVFDMWGRFIDDIFALFKGNKQKCNEIFTMMNSLYPGNIKVTWEFSETSVVFLNLEVIINKEKKCIETKYYVKPTNQRLFLNYRSNHPQHVFKSVVYSMALMGIMVNSRQDWNVTYLRDLREKFLEQEYPMQLINEQFSRALAVDRLDLLFTSKEKKKKKIIAPLIITFNPGNPQFSEWIREDIKILHEDENLKKVFPTISVVTRQNANIKRRIMRNKYTRKEEQNTSIPPPGNFRRHDLGKCVCCDRMTDNQTKVTITKTGREYEIRRHYTCLDNHVVYLVTCLICQCQYVGQTSREMRKRHYGHRSEVKTNTEGLGEHFHAHATQLGLDLKVSREMDQLMQSFSLVVVGSVQPGKPWSQSRLDKLEADLQHRFQCLEKHGGIGSRDETRRRRNGQ